MKRGLRDEKKKLKMEKKFGGFGKKGLGGEELWEKFW
jgi:hypothetical protein